jgi:WD40 repeat protein
VLSARFKFLHPNRQPDDTKIVSGSVDTTCKVWDLLTGALVRTIEMGTDVCTVSWGLDWVRAMNRHEAFALGPTRGWKKHSTRILCT